MNPQRIKIPRASDKIVVAAFEELMKKFDVPQIGISALGFVSFTISGVGENEELAALLSQNSTLIETVSFGIDGFSVAYHRGGNYQPDQKSAIFDEITFSHNQNSPAPASTRLEIVSYLTKKLKALEPGRVVSGITEEQSQLLAIHQSTLERLEALSEDLIQKGAAFRENVEKKFFDKASELENQQAAYRAQLEASFQEKEARLSEREQELEEKVRHIDDRDNTHVRREIRDKMLDDVKARISKFGVSAATSKKRWPVGVAILITALVLGAIMSWTGYEIHRYDSVRANAAAVALRDGTSQKPISSDAGWISAPEIWLLWGKFSLASFFLFGTILYYVRWQARWAEQHAVSEFQLQQFYLDVNRANWLIESCLEWRKETASPIPGVLLESITRGLFQPPGSKEDRDVDPADQLASALMGSASKLRLNIGGNEVEFNKPGKIRGAAKKEADP